VLNVLIGSGDLAEAFLMRRRRRLLERRARRTEVSLSLDEDDEGAAVAVAAAEGFTRRRGSGASSITDGSLSAFDNVDGIIAS
jgi:hypothetical protein